MEFGDGTSGPPARIGALSWLISCLSELVDTLLGDKALLRVTYRNLATEFFGDVTRCLEDEFQPQDDALIETFSSDAMLRFFNSA